MSVIFHNKNVSKGKPQARDFCGLELPDKPVGRASSSRVLNSEKSSLGLGESRRTLGEAGLARAKAQGGPHAGVYSRFFALIG